MPSSPSSKDDMRPTEEGESSDDKENDDIPTSLPQKSKRPSARQKSFFVSPKEKKKAMEVGLASIVGVNKLTKELYSPGRGTGIFQDKTPGNFKKGGTRKNKTKFTEDDLRKMFSTRDIIASAQVSASMRRAPVSQQSDKKKALAELVASIPSSDREEAKSDGQRIMHATKQFNKKPHHDGQGRWKITGLITPLMHHQVSKISPLNLQ